MEELEKGPSTIHLRVIHRTSVFIPIFRELQLMRRFPFTVQAGEATWVVVAAGTKMRQLLRRLSEHASSVEVDSIQHFDRPARSGPLTARQTDLLHQAMAAGYFEVPRKITLTKLAESLEIAPSTLSEGLAIVERKLLQHSAA
ncbi:MAG: helix-turn-helix domain-containing protein [Nitrososphaerales archaeon]